ncbi:MAG: zinc-binding dehydrogenase [Actinobacteria bacterium]|nr:zinc-binding dehydrogenase [Actinomycetota bacterium]
MNAWPSTTRAAVMHDYAAPLVIEDVPLPSELEPGAAIVRVTCTTLCGTDAHLWDGRLAEHIPIARPMIHGHEMVGELVAGSGPDALGRPLSPGDRVVWSEAVCGHCRACTVLGQSVHCERRALGFMQSTTEPPHATGGLAEYVYVRPGAARLLVPDELTDPWAAAAGCAVKTVIRAFANGGGVPTGETVVVQGSGPLGLFATAYARAGGAARVITVGAPDARLDIARHWGADTTVSVESTAGPDERVARVLELTGGHGAELVLDFAGAPTASAEGVLMCAPRGTYVVVGIAGPGATPLPVPVVMGRELRVVGSMNGDTGDLARALDFLLRERARFDWDVLFADPVGLGGATDALRAMAAETVGKPVVRPGIA